MGRPVIHWELWTNNREKLSDFYAKTFNWKVKANDETKYNLVETGAKNGINGGIMTPQRKGPWPGNMSFYIEVDDLAAYSKRIVAAGGKIVSEEQKVPGMGSYVLFHDPEGRVMGLWKIA
jgi:predicted enzyme related to lactoylglutathione lyase